MNAIPTWHECDYRLIKGVALTPLQTFIYEYSPADRSDERVFRSRLLDVMNEVFESGAHIGEQWDGDIRYIESSTIYGNLTPEEIEEYNGYEDLKNRGN